MCFLIFKFLDSQMEEKNSALNDSKHSLIAIFIIMLYILCIIYYVISSMHFMSMNVAGIRETWIVHQHPYLSGQTRKTNALYIYISCFQAKRSIQTGQIPLWFRIYFFLCLNSSPYLRITFLGN
jgi:hypothetical protein